MVSNGKLVSNNLIILRLNFISAKLTAIGYGIKKLQISCHIEDEKVSVDDIQEQIQANEDYVQSTDIDSFTKL
jgi:elongation factor 1-beta